MRRAMWVGVIVLWVAGGTASGAILTVPAEYPRIQAAIDAARDGDTVVVSPGVRYETINFSGKNITVTSIDPNDPKIVGYSIINADGDGSAVTFENGETPAAKLIGFTITDGYGTADDILGEPYKAFWGGGIYCKGASPTITRNIIARNRCPIEVTSNDLAQIKVSYGGGIGCIHSDAVITNNLIRGNSAYVGGGIIAYLGNPRVANNVICENSAVAGAGATLLQGQLLNNTIVANDVLTIGGVNAPGGSVYLVFDPTVVNCLVSGNVICNSGTSGILLQGLRPPAGSIVCNDVWGNAPGNYSMMDNTGTGQLIYDGEISLAGVAGNICADPLFVNFYSRDYHLTAESPCINAGDPNLVVPAGERDLDFRARVHGLRTDIGADEYVGYVKPVACAGPDRHVLELLQVVALDGDGSFFSDPCGIRAFRWAQVGGPAVNLDDPNAAQPAFTPGSPGEYAFQLVVSDGRYSSEPDRVRVLVAANQVPMADAGSDRAWCLPGLVTLDGTASRDPDPIDRLTYQWRQIEGPPVDLRNADTATPSFMVDAEGRWAFELVVSDGFARSQPSRVQCTALTATLTAQSIAVPLIQTAATYHVDVSGPKIVYTVPGTNTYELRIVCTDLLTKKIDVVYEGGTNVRPKVDGDLVTWFGGVSYQDNSGPACTSVFVANLATGARQTLASGSDTSSFSHPAVSGRKVVWVQQLGLEKGADGWSYAPYDICGADLSQPDRPLYFTIATRVGRHDLFSFAAFVGDGDDVVDISGNIVVWEAGGDIYAADISDLDRIQVVTVCDQPARQYDPAISGHFVVWTDQRHDSGDIYGADLTDLTNIRESEVAKGPGVQQQPVIDGPHVVYTSTGAGGSLKLACITQSSGALNASLPVSYAGNAPALDGRTLVWLGNSLRQIGGASIAFGYPIADGRVQNVQKHRRYDYLQHAIADANSGDTVIASAGLYEEKIDFAGKPLTVRSADPADPAVVAATVLSSDGSIVSCVAREDGRSTLAGVTITGGAQGIYAYGASPLITRCVITGNSQAGVRLLGSSNPTITTSGILANGGAGIEMSPPPSEGRVAKQAEATIRNCLIVANRGQGVHGGKPKLINCTVVENLLEGIATFMPTVVNSIVHFNNQAGDGTQIDSTRATVSYSDIEGGWPGDGNIDGDPCFVTMGSWTFPAGSGPTDSRAVWTPGDYHLKSQGWRWNAAERAWVSDEVTSPCIDAGDPVSALEDEPRTAPGDSTGAVVNQRIDIGMYGGSPEASLAPMSP